MNVLSKKNSNLFSVVNILKFFIMSGIGIFIFFIPVTITGKTTIPVDHLITWFQSVSLVACQIFALFTFVYGAILPFVEKTWNKNTVSTVFTFLKIAGAILGFMVFLKIGPEVIMRPDMLPFIFNKVALPVGLIVPIGSVLLMFLTGYGLLEFLGVLMRPIMRPVWKVPGLGALNAVTSFVGSFSVGMLMTNRLYKEGRFTRKEAIIVLTGFSTVSATFMVIVAKTLGLISIWNTFFWSTLAITFFVSAITIRLRPLSGYPDTFYNEEGNPEKKLHGNLFVNAFKEGLIQAQNSSNVVKNIGVSFKEGIQMSARFLPVVMSVGLIGYYLAKMTPVFDYAGYIFYPFTYLLKIPDPLLVAKASLVAVVDMFIPSVLVAGMGADVAMASKYVVGVVSISAIMFFDGTIPIVIATDVRMPLKDQLLIFFERVVLTIIVAGIASKLIF